MLSTTARHRATPSYDGPRAPSSGLRNRIDPAGREWTAPGDAPGAEGGPLQSPMGPDRLERVGRARGVESASTDQEPADRRAIRGQDSDEGPPEGSAQNPARLPHQRISPASVNSCRISSISSGDFESPNGPRATRTTSCPSRTRGQSARDASRSRRRARLRATAPPTRFPVTQAARDGPGRGATYTTTRPDLWDLPSRRARRIAEGSTRSDAEPGPAFPAPPPQDRAAGARAHPRSETVRSLPSARAGLIGPLHGGN